MAFSTSLPSVSIVGCGWVGLPAGQMLASQEYLVRGSTTRASRQEVLADAGISPFVTTLQPAPAPEAPALFKSDILLCTLPPGRSNATAANENTYAAQIRALMQQAKTHDVGRVIYTSSTGVYPPVNGTVDESDFDPQHPEDFDAPARHTAHAVRKAERIITAAYPEASVLLRLGGLFGPERHPGRFIAGRTNVARPHGPVNMVHRDDVVGAITHVIRNDVREGIFNVVAPKHPTRRVFYEAAATDYGGTPPTFGPAEGPTGKRVSSARLVETLGYTFQHPDPIALFQQQA
ncbi:MAG: NAD(P)H-binding protein [Longimonas sp.]|uniref:NAD-dependent epimerase/dehydratase family protein n=1 Tax=Longimonas sp. TaxID=2039626 RepID=UPI0033576627